MSPDQWICVGKIVGVHGVKGAVKVKSFTQTPEDITEHGTLKTGEGAFLTLHFLHMNKDIVVARIDDINTREQAALLKNTDLYLERSTLDEVADDEFYIVDLVGSDVFVDGKKIGNVLKVNNFGAGDLLQITLHDGGTAIEVPFRREFVPEVDLPGKKLSVDPDYFASLKDLIS